MTTPTDDRVDHLLTNYLERNRKLQTWAWVSVAIPVALFVLFSALTIREARRYAALSEKIESQRETIAKQQKQIDEQRNQIAISGTAISFVSKSNPGPRPTVDIYRRSIAGQVVPALKELGYNVQLIPSQENPNLVEIPVDTLEYGCGVSNEDIRTIAVALTEAGLQIRRIDAATKKPDPHLVQVIASGMTRAMGLSTMTVDQIKAWSRPDKPCSR